MRLRDHITRDLVFVLRDAPDKRTFLRRLVDLVQRQLPVINPEQLYGRLLERERLVTTGIGHGVAIPHATVEGLPETVCVVVQTPQGVDFEALDAAPVVVTFLLLSPPGRTGLHIRLLARIARLADSAAFISSIASAHSDEEIYTLTLAEDDRHV
jgi:PTS system nitrogen regulatory IIA component